MATIFGTYQNGYVKLDKNYTSNEPVKVIITFLEEMEPDLQTGIRLSDFSFSESQLNLINSKSSFSASLIEERRSEL